LPGQEGAPMKAYVLVTVHTGDIPEAVRQLRQVKGVRAVEATFGVYDAVVEIEAADLKTIGRTVAFEIQTVAGVKETLTCLVMDGL
jgi:DNA-binding Lrp family transcriptional regulator